MREITSRDNRIFRQALSLEKKKNRDELGMYLIEGENLVHEAVKNQAEIETVFVSPRYEKSLFGLEDRTFMLDEKLFERLSETETPQGIIAVVRKREYDPYDYAGPGECILVLDRLQDPGNIGTILRTADAAGYSMTVFMKGTADPFSSKVVRAATGSLFRMPVVSMASVKELTEFTRATGKKIAATAMDAESCYYDEDLTRDIALVIGNEGNGISEELIESSDLKIRIPMHGNIESLNAAVSAGIIMYERNRK